MAPANLPNKAKKKTPLEPSFPGLTPPGGASAPNQSPYTEIQEDEQVALASIYGDDFQAAEAKAGAWKKAEPSFSIQVRSSDSDISVKLKVVLVATYPRSAPLLSLESDEHLRESTRYKLQNVLKEKPRELLARGEPMIMEIVQAIEEILADAASAKAAGVQLPSLEEERAIHEAAAAKLAQEAEREELHKREAEDEEEARTLLSMVEDERRRQKAKAKEAKKKSKPPTLSKEISLDDDILEPKEKLLFDQPSTVIDEDNNQRLFQAVTDMVRIRQGPVSTCFTVRPILRGTQSRLMALKQAKLNSSSESTKSRNLLQTLEVDLEALKKIRHRNVLEVLDYKLHKDNESRDISEGQYTISVLTDYADKGSLEEFLEIAGSLGVEKVRAWTIELLDGLRYLHDKGIVHQDLHASNILLVRSSAGDITAKIADAGYQRLLHELAPSRATNTFELAKNVYWLPPENSNVSKPQYTQKSDIWDFGVIFLQMIFGIAVLQKYASPERVTEALNLSEPLEEILHKFFRSDPKKRPRAFELSSCEFLATDAQIMADLYSSSLSRLGSASSLMPQTPVGRQRHDSMNTANPFSRYKFDFYEEGRLGKGGFGEVVKARKKLDGQFYAIKKITQASSTSLSQVLKEVRLLSQLSHPYVVRYYNTWTEEITDVAGVDADSATTNDESNISTEISVGTGPNIEFGTSTGGLDFMSSSGLPPIEFGYDSDENGNPDESTESDSDEDNSYGDSSDESSLARNAHGGENGRGNNLQRIRSDSHYSRSTKTILYIQMEYCERRTLSDLIKRGLHKDLEEIWRLLRQLLEGLAHIHSLNVVHRDLKPDNIFIDGALNVRIGDFGLATSGQYSVPDLSGTTQDMHNMTTSIGTASYVAPEVSSKVGEYNSKVDMYSLGVILFEMCYPPPASVMERAHILRQLREKEPVLPSDFDLKDKAVQADIILSLVDHNPKERPGAAGLLQGGKLPVQMESETIRQILAGLSDPNSPYYQKMMAALFSRPTTQATEIAWGMDGFVNSPVNELIMHSIVKEQLTAIFRRHGAVEAARTVLFPRSAHYGPNAVQLLESSGTLVQLPYDLTLPHARSIAKFKPPMQRSFTFGTVFRDKNGGQPVSFGEADFDIVSDSLDLALKEAETIKVLDEIVNEFPSLAATQMCFHLNHSDLLNLIFEFCRIELHLRPAVAEVLSKLNIQQWTWPKIRNELRSPLIGVPTTSLDDLQRFDFRDTPIKAFQKLKTNFEGTDFFERAAPAIAHLNEVIEYTKRFNVHCKIYINLLSSLKDKFYKGGILFSCIYDLKRRDIFAAGGRYDSLIREYRPKMGAMGEDRNAVGFSMAWEKLSISMSRHMKSGAKAFLKKSEDEMRGAWTARRCNVLVSGFDPSGLRSTGVDLLQHLWENDISAELAMDARSLEDLMSKHRDDQHGWIVIIKQDETLKVKSVGRKDVQDVDIPKTQLVSWLRGEIREREHKEGNYERAKLTRHISHTEGSTINHNQEVRLHMAQTKSKKSNRHNLVEQAQGQAAQLVQSFLDGPILAIETTDFALGLIKETRLSDPDSWRKACHGVPTAERRYMEEIHDLVKGMAHLNRDITKNAFVYNFRTGTCIYYDMSQ